MKTLKRILVNKNIKINKLNNENKRLLKIKENYTLALDSANDALWAWDLITDEVSTSDKWIEITGSAVVGNGLNSIIRKEIIHPNDYEKVVEVFHHCLEGKSQDFYSEYRIKNLFGNYSWVQNRGKAYYNKDGIIIKMAGAILNIDERKQKESDLEYMAYYDGLTGLANKTLFMKTLDELIGRNEADDMSILMLDLDDFKEHNDLLGLEFCDALLKIIGRKLSQLIGHDNMIARFGGDEFLILIRDSKSIEELEDICNKIIAFFNRPFVLLGNTIYLTSSIGVIFKLDAGKSSSEIIRNADIALNKAKSQGKNQHCLYDKSMHDEIVRRSAVARAIREGLKEDKFILNYQPQKAINEVSINRVEVLTRLHSNLLGDIPPIEFIEVAEYTGLIIPLGNWILENACRQAKKWIDAGYKLKKLAINISVKQVQDKNFYNDVIRILEKTKMPIDKVEFEITESIFLNSSNNCIKVLEKLQRQGISFALDDFGTGYSSLNYITVLPIEILKIDKTFLDKAANDSRIHKLIKSIIKLAHNMNLKVVAEGVETREQKERLKEMNCDYIQGYYLSRPVDSKKIEEFLKTCKGEGIYNKA